MCNIPLFPNHEFAEHGSKKIKEPDQKEVNMHGRIYTWVATFLFDNDCVERLYKAESTTELTMYLSIGENIGTIIECNDVQCILDSYQKCYHLPCVETIKADNFEIPKSSPIKSLEDIDKIRNYLHEHEEYRAEAMLIIGVNWCLSANDFSNIMLSDIITARYEYKSPVLIYQNKKNKRYYINQAIHKALKSYLATRGKYSSRKVFFTFSGGDFNVMNTCFKDLALPYYYTSDGELYRKTAAYWRIMTAKDKQKSLVQIQDILGFESQEKTLAFMEISEKELSTPPLQIDTKYENIIDIESATSIPRIKLKQKKIPKLVSDDVVV